MQSEKDPQTPDAKTTTTAAERKAEQARINGRKSQGPTSAIGKGNSCKNAYKHGLTAKHVVPGNQNKQLFEEMLAAYRHDFNPATLAEVQCIDRMAHAAFNQNAGAIETTALLDHKRLQMAATTHTDPTMPEQLRTALAVDALLKESSTFDTYQRYIRDADRRFSRALRDLILLRKSLRENPALDAETDEQHAPAPALKPKLSKILIAPNPVPEISPRKNEPTEVAENTENASSETQPETPAETAVDTYLGAQPTPAATPDSETAHESKPGEWAALTRVRNALHAFPEAYKAAAQALRDLPDEDRFLPESRS